MDKTKYVTCIRCAHVISWYEHEQLRFAMDCPACGAKKQFGLDVYVPDFSGITFKEALARKVERNTHNVELSGDQRREEKP